MRSGMNLMMKCDMCYDRTSVGKKPMCATVCPSQALLFGTREEVARLRPGSRVLNTFRFGAQVVTTKVNMLVPARARVEQLDVLSALHEPPVANDPVADPMLSGLATEEAPHAD
jgi:Fe-S-cluster-containing dehydrogenase component